MSKVNKIYNKSETSFSNFRNKKIISKLKTQNL